MAPSQTSNPFDASATALGYAYQFRFALKQALAALRVDYNWTVRIEAADDVEIRGSSFLELQQLKHVKQSSTLTDSSRELWKTIRIWSDSIRLGAVALPQTTFILISTGEVSPTSAAALLTESNLAERDVSIVRQRLLTAGERSKDDTVSKGFEAFSKLADSDQLELLERIRIAPRSDDVIDIRQALLGEIRVGLRREHLDEYLERLEGWWFQACLECLVDARQGIGALELEAYCSDLRDRLQPDNLPIDLDVVQSAAPELEVFAGRIFVKQMELATRSRNRIQSAVREYLRASSQRSRWLRKNLLQIGEVEDYERRLKEEWQLVFDRLIDDLDADGSDDEKSKIAKRMIGWAEEACFPIRSAFTEAFVCRGSLHMLSDNLEIGWHPEYMVRVLEVVEPPSGQAR